MWHTNIRMINPEGTEGTVFPTRAYFTGSGVLVEVADFTDTQHLQAIAAHELGHFLVNWKQGAWMHSISIQDGGRDIIPKGVTRFCYPGGEWKRSVLVGGAAGERACDRWLHEEKLWSRARAAYGEMQGRADRDEAVREDPSITFDGGPNDYQHLQDEADKVLDEVWPMLRRGLEHFNSYAEYTGDLMCVLLGVLNNPSAM
jgi:hypothetical protein